jgi:hypothetical protein
MKPFAFAIRNAGRLHFNPRRRDLRDIHLPPSIGRSWILIESRCHIAQRCVRLLTIPPGLKPARKNAAS